MMRETLARLRLAGGDEEAMRGFSRGGAWRAWAIAGGLFVAGCGGDDGSAGAGDTEGDDSTGSTGDRDTDGMTGANTMSTSAGGTGTTTAPPGIDSTGDEDSGNDTAGFITAGNTDDGPVGPQPNGAQCGSADECESGFCYDVPMVGGVCSECLSDSDCGTGTCALDFQMLYAVCTDGSQGVMCDSDRGCMGDLVCEPLVDTGGVFPLNFCSECGANAACPDGQTCTPVYDTVAFQGYHGCAEPGSVADGGGCPVEGGVGDGSVCMSGACGIANVFGVVDIGVCGECASDDDCTPPATCTPPTADMSGITPSSCG